MALIRFEREPLPVGPITALTVHQPWAWAIVAGHKPVENRGWRTKHRGWLAIHAALHDAARFSQGVGFVRGQGIEPPAELPCQAVIGLAHVAGVVRFAECGGPWAVGPWCWVLDAVIQFRKPVPASGRPGLWAWSPPEGCELRELVGQSVVSPRGCLGVAVGRG